MKMKLSILKRTVHIYVIFTTLLLFIGIEAANLRAQGPAIPPPAKSHPMIIFCKTNGGTGSVYAVGNACQIAVASHCKWNGCPPEPDEQ